MCGRYASVRKADDLASMLDAEVEAEVPADYNVAPTASVPICLTDDDGGRRLTVARWGFTTEQRASVINARVETLAARPMFRGPLRGRRAILPAEGYYEWTDKLPWYVTSPDGSPLWFAGLWEVGDVAGRETLQAVIVTGPATSGLAWLHGRTPMVVPPAAWSAWLDPSYDGDPRDLLRPATLAASARRVSTKVNSVRNTGPDLLAIIDGHWPNRPGAE